jgi:3',5'-cyclic-nucleotide phosphodiesterase
VAFDAGGLSRTLPIERQIALETVVVSHSHLDHVRDLATLADTRTQRGSPPLRVLASAHTLAALRRHLFNGAIWPDFTRIPSERRPALRFVEIRPGVRFRAGGFSFLPIPVHHSVPALGFLVRTDDGAVLISGDTGPTRDIWAAARRAGTRLRGVFAECSFPGRFRELADHSGHYCPDSLARDLRTLGPALGSVPVFLYHVKPGFGPEIEDEIHREIDGVVLARSGLLFRPSG